MKSRVTSSLSLSPPGFGSREELQPVEAQNAGLGPKSPAEVLLFVKRCCLPGFRV